MRVFSSISKLTWVFVFPLLFSCTTDEDDNTTTCIKTDQEAPDSEQQRLQLQAQLNNGNSTPPAGGRISNDF